MNKKKEKEDGKVYTPSHIVNLMLDYGGYTTDILKKHVIDNSCGDGAFLKEIVTRYITCFFKISNDTNELKNELSTYIHGIELNSDECQKCINNLNVILHAYNIPDIDWDIMCANTLTVKKYDGMMDYVFGNPPYVRIHNIKTKDNLETYELLKQMNFTSNGSVDLYMAFYEIGLQMKKPNGILCYIAPNGWLNGSSGKIFRKYIEDKRSLYGIVDFEHTQVFEDAQTYVLVTLFKQENNNNIGYSIYKDETFVSASALTYNDIFINDKIYFAAKEDLNIIKKTSISNSKNFIVKNGLATLADKIFIDNLPNTIKYKIPVVKASNGRWKYCLFTYDEKMNPLSLEDIRINDKETYDYIFSNEELLKKRAYDTKGQNSELWWILGRSQGINDINKNKIAVNNLIRDISDIKLEFVEAGCGIYSGYYILTDKSIQEVKKILLTPNFIKYVKSLRKYKSGQYYTFSAIELENYLNSFGI